MPKKKGPARKRVSKKTALKHADQKKTADFLIALSKNPKLRSEWRKDPIGTMHKADLSEAAIKALMSGDPKKVARALGKYRFIVICVIIFWGTGR
jgi:hypothetical protein